MIGRFSKIIKTYIAIGFDSSRKLINNQISKRERHQNIINYRNMLAEMDPLFLKSTLTIGTHNGQFHCDEALACYLIKTLQPLATVVRSRDDEILKAFDIRVDVGGVYDPQTHSYDHHQSTFHHTMSTLSDLIKSDIRLSSAGLIYHHFGKHVIGKLIESNDEEKIDYIYERVYYELIREVDGIDNGVPQFESEPSYHINSHLSARVSRLNPPWNSDDKWDVDKQFLKAVDLVGQEFNQAVQRATDIMYPARELVKNAIISRHSIHYSGEIIELFRYCDWKEHLFEMERKLGIESHIKYVLFPGEGGSSYRVAGVPLSPKSFVGRKFLPTVWRGLRGDELSKMSGIKGCIFVHSTGFMGGNDSREGALEMAIKSLKMTDDDVNSLECEN